MAGSRAPQTKRKRPGRPPRGEYVDKRKTLSTRITSDLRDRLDKSADESGRSLSQEIEFRLEQSFRDQEALYREFGDELVYKMMRWFAIAIDAAQQVTDKSWKNDRETFRIATQAIWTMLRKGIPESGGLPDRFADRMGKRLGNQLAWWASDGRLGKQLNETPSKGKSKG